MKINLNEYGGSFDLEIEAETKEDAAALVRLGMNHLQELRTCMTYVYSTGAIVASVVIGKSKKPTTIVGGKR